jgi:hypothetical protein
MRTWGPRYSHNDISHGPDMATSDDEEFVYPAADEQNSELDIGTPEHVSEHEQEQLASSEEQLATYEPPASTTSSPSPAQLEALFAASSAGDLEQLKSVFHNAQYSSSAEAFALANDASTRTGLTALHAAASRGFLDIVIWCQ